MNVGELKLAVVVEPWFSVLAEGMTIALTKAVDAGMPKDLAVVIMREVMQTAVPRSVMAK